MKFIALVLSLGLLAGCTNPAPSGGATPTPAPSSSPTPPPSVACAIETTIANGIASYIGTQAGCANPAALADWALANIGKANLCVSLAASKATLESAQKHQLMSLKADAKSGVATQGVIADVLCPLAVNALFSAGFSALPAAAQCSGGTATTAQIQAWATAGCEKLPL